MPTQLAIERWADMPQFVHHGDKFLLEIQVQEPRQIEIQDVEHLTAAGVEESLERPAASPPVFHEGSPLESHRGQGCPQAVPGADAGLRERKGDLARVNVAQLGHTGRHVGRDRLHPIGKVEPGYRPVLDVG